MQRSYDVVIIGGGVMGSSTAYWLAAHPSFTGSILSVERDPSYKNATTALSLGSIRQQFSTPENVQMSLFGAQFLAVLGDYLAVDGAAPDISYHSGGYLFLASTAGLPVLESNHRVQKPLGAENVILTAAELAARFPWLNTSDLVAGSLGLHHEGWLDPYSLLQAFRRKAMALGADYVKDTVLAIGRDGKRAVSVSLAEGGTVSCGLVVNAAGPQAGAGAALAGPDLPVRGRKRLIYVVDCRTKGPCAHLGIDSSGGVFPAHGVDFLR